jgi:hypothetical protein
MPGLMIGDTAMEVGSLVSVEIRLQIAEVTGLPLKVRFTVNTTA